MENLVAICGNHPDFDFLIPITPRYDLTEYILTSVLIDTSSNIFSRSRFSQYDIFYSV
ncbi:MAG: hypothetical protein JSV68_03835 [Anaerolineaceae bacterium]|nr:MAG: hypothetical protein JSV68_03835 [Anaerolineaceae bacterium]